MQRYLQGGRFTWRLPWVLALCFVASNAAAGEPASVASATTEDEGPEDTSSSAPEAEEGQRFFGLGPTLGFYHATGAELIAGTRSVAVGLSGGYVPLLITTTSSDQDEVDWNFLHSYQADADLAVRLFEVKKTSFGAQPGYRYNSELGSGFAVGGYAAHDLGRVMQLRGYYGILYYPNATTLLRQRDDVDDAADFGLLGPALQGGVSVSLLFYP